MLKATDTVTHTKGKTRFVTGAVRGDKTGQGRCDLLPPDALLWISHHLENGATAENGYGARNWEKGIPLWSWLDSMMRHLLKEMNGDVSEDHAAAFCFNALGYLATRLRIQRGHFSPTNVEALLEGLPSDLRDHIQEDYFNSSPNFKEVKPDAPQE